MLIAWEVCQWTVCTPKRWASILLDMSMSWNVTIMYLLTPRANKQQQVVEFSSPSSSLVLESFVKNTYLCFCYHNLNSSTIGFKTGQFLLCRLIHKKRYTVEDNDL